MGCKLLNRYYNWWFSATQMYWPCNLIMAIGIFNEVEFQSRIQTMDVPQYIFKIKRGLQHFK